MITTSGGGALICNGSKSLSPDPSPEGKGSCDGKSLPLGGDLEEASPSAQWREVMMYATQFRESYPYYQHEKIGYNYRMSNICAGIGRGQMTIVNDHIAHHKHVQALYEELLDGVEGIKVHKAPLEASPKSSPEGKDFGIHTADPMWYNLLKDNAEQHRENPTQAESILWNRLKANGLGYKFRQQHIIEDFIVDFYCNDKKLTIEINGGYHNAPIQMKSDQDRSARLNELGYTEIRFTNDEVIANLDAVIDKIVSTCNQLPSLQGRAGERLLFDSNYWLCTMTLDPGLRIKGQENAYKEIVTGAVGGAAGVIHAADSAVTDCQPNDNVEALRVFMLDKKVECRPLWKPMHKQPVYQGAPAYVNGVSESIFKVGMCLPSGPCVSDDDVRYIVDCIKEAIVK